MYGFICVVVFLDCFVVWIYRITINVCCKTIKNVQFTCHFRESRGLLLPTTTTKQPTAQRISIYNTTKSETTTSNQQQ